MKIFKSPGFEWNWRNIAIEISLLFISCSILINNWPILDWKYVFDIYVCFKHHFFLLRHARSIRNHSQDNFAKFIIKQDIMSSITDTFKALEIKISKATFRLKIAKTVPDIYIKFQK